MRRFAANDRLIGNEQTAATVDAPERETYVETDTNPTNPATLEVGCDAGTVVINGTDVSVNAQSESVPDLTGTVTETAYAYHTLSIDNTGTLVVRTSDTGEFNAANPDDPPITQVTEVSHAAGECYLGTAFQVEGSIERVFDGRYVIGTLPNSIITQGQGSGLDADTLRGKTASDLISPIYGDGSDGEIVRSSNGTEDSVLLTERYKIEPGVTRTVDGIAVIQATEEIVIDGTLTAKGQGGAAGTGGSGGSSDGGNGTAGNNATAADLVGGGGAGGSGGSAGSSDPAKDGGNGSPGGTAAGGGGGGGGGTEAEFSDGGGGGSGGDGTSGSVSDGDLRALRRFFSTPWDNVYDLAYLGGGGGAGGGGGGGGGSGSGATGGDGGDGGAGGGVIALIAPSIQVSNGTVTADGEDATNGGDGENAIGAGGGGGGGGGGDGGAVLVVTSSVDDSSGFTADGGAGGAGGTGGSSDIGAGGNGASGGNGEDGLVYTIGV